jgi:Flp pilus assembly protein TadB
MSAARSSEEQPRRRRETRPADIAQLRARRREASRRRRLARVDLGLGLALALVLLVATPGVAIAALIAGIVLAVCLTSFVVERRRRARGRESRSARRSR